MNDKHRKEIDRLLKKFTKKATKFIEMKIEIEAEARALNSRIRYYNLKDK